MGGMTVVSYTQPGTSLYFDQASGILDPLCAGQLPLQTKPVGAASDCRLRINTDATANYPLQFTGPTLPDYQLGLWVFDSKMHGSGKLFRLVDIVDDWGKSAKQEICEQTCKNNSDLFSCLSLANTLGIQKVMFLGCKGHAGDVEEVGKQRIPTRFVGEWADADRTFEVNADGSVRLLWSKFRNPNDITCSHARFHMDQDCIEFTVRFPKDKSNPLGCAHWKLFTTNKAVVRFDEPINGISNTDLEVTFTTAGLQ